MDRSISTSLPCRQSSAPAAIGGRLLTVVQEYAPHTTAGAVRVITLDADTGEIVLDDPLDPDLFGGFDLGEFAAGCHIGYETIVHNNKLLIPINGYTVTY